MKGFLNTARQYVYDLLLFLFLFTSIAQAAGGPMTPTPTAASPNTLQYGVDYTTDGVVNVPLSTGQTMYVGGDFHRVRIGDSEAERDHLALLDTLNRRVGTWNPAPNAPIEAIIITDQTIYVAGQFTIISGEERSYLASFNRTDHQLSSLNLNINAPVYALALDGNKLYIGGAFTQINGQTRNRLTSIDISTNALTAWTPNANDTVYAITIDQSRIYVGGAFTAIDDKPRTHLAAFDRTTGQLLDWAPRIDVIVKKITIQGGTVLATGDIFLVDEGIINRQVASVDIQTGQVTIEQTIQLTPTPILTPGIAGSELMVDPGKLGFKIPSLADVLTFAIRIFFVIAGLAGLLYMLLGALAWVTSGGDKDSVKAARDKIQAAIIGIIVIVAVLAIIWTVEQVVFAQRVCFGISCPLTIPALLEPSDPTPTP